MSTAKTKSTATPTAEAVKQIEEAVAVQKETIENVVKAGASAAGKGVDKAVSLTKEHVDAAVKVGSQAFKGYEDILQFNKDNVDALVRSSTIVVRGVQDLSKTLVSLAQESIEESVAASKALIGAKTLKDVVDLSASITKSNLDRLIAESTRLSQLSTKLAEEAFAPLNSRVDAAVRKLTKTAA